MRSTRVTPATKEVLYEPDARASESMIAPRGIHSLACGLVTDPCRSPLPGHTQLTGRAGREAEAGLAGRRGRGRGAVQHEPRRRGGCAGRTVARGRRSLLCRGPRGPARPAQSPEPEVESNVTTKLVPESVSTDVVSSRLPRPDAMLMASDCQAESSIGPLTPLIVADALVNVTDPKFARSAMLSPTVGASTIHSAELRAAAGLCVAEES